ncbi:HAMP domain-containing sensor histidine kinase [Mollicutes bacterium LVI A0039]|nr:HAMP domain-containing sensor histidine kinase [Mollicutes bacterium LVI A0039]
MINNELTDSLEQVVRLIDEPVLVIDNKGLLLTVNNLFKDTFRFGKYRIRKGKHISKCLDEHPKILSLINKILEKSESNLENEYRLKHNGRYYTVKVSLFGKSNGSGYFVLFHDMTEKETLEKKLKVFTSDVAHEIRTPLAGISAIAELLAYNDKMTTGEMRTEAKFIYDEVSRLTDLVNDLLQMSRNEVNAKRLDITELEIDSLINHVVSSIKPRLGEGDYEFILDVHAKHVYGDFNALVQVLLNLLDNACTYGKSKIRLKVSEDENYTIFKVEDDGMGLTQQQASRIFERFYRTDESRNKNSGGTGLGLAIVKDLVDSHDGKIAVRSKVGIGTDFIISIPKNR